MIVDRRYNSPPTLEDEQIVHSNEFIHDLGYSINVNKEGFYHQTNDALMLDRSRVVRRLMIDRCRREALYQFTKGNTVTPEVPLAGIEPFV